MDKNGHNDEVNRNRSIPCSPSSPRNRSSPASPDKPGSGKSPDAKVRFSFEDELTFSPRLNSLSLKMVSEVNRPSITQRKQEKKVDEQLDYAFKPNLSTNSSKIVAKMNTCFWDRQNKVVQRRLEMIEQGPSTIHPNLKSTASVEKRKAGGVITSLSEHKCTLNEALNKKNKRSKSKSPYCKSVEVLIKLKKEDIALQLAKLKRKCNQNQTDENRIVNPDRDTNISNIIKNTNVDGNKMSDDSINIKNNKIDKIDTNNNMAGCQLNKRNERYKKEKLINVTLKDSVSVTSPLTESFPNITSPKDNQSKPSPPRPSPTKCRQFKTSPSKGKYKFSDVRKKKSINDSIDSNTNEDSDDKSVPLEKEVSKRQARKLAYPLTNRDRTNEMDAVHQNLIKMKKVAGQAIKKKKVFVCNGPYSPLRVALRRRGWIEKHYKGGDPSLVPQMCVSNSYREDEGQNSSRSNSRSSLYQDEVNEEADETKDFMCDNQYGIMSRIVRKSMPIFLWTLKRDDLNFRYLHKDQIVNHFLFARTFTTKAGLCMTLDNLRYFDDLNASTFFPRCYRLCCDEEKEEFIENYQLTALQSILKIVIEKHEAWEKYYNSGPDQDESSNTGASDKRAQSSREKIILNTDVLRLAFKTSYDYLESKHHADIEESYQTIDDIQKTANWTKIVEYFKKLAHQDGMIAGVSEYVDECRRILCKMEEYHPQLKIDGSQNVWILKPGAKSRGRGIEVMNVLSDILNLSSDTISKKENRWVIQKYIERPYLIYRTKFDIRQWILVTDWNPLMLWFYKDCYIRFCGQEFQLDKFDPQVHLSNNAVQKNYKIGIRSDKLPDSNMWSSDEFKDFLKSRGQENYWEEVIYPGMKKAIIAVLISSQETLEYRKNSFELYGADFMIGEDFQPWLIEINASPSLGASTPVTERLCRNVLEDTLKVVLDRRENRECDTGRFELAYKRPFVPLPSYIGCTIAVDGTGLTKPAITKKKYNNVTKVTPRGILPLRVNEDDSNTTVKSPVPNEGVASPVPSKSACKKVIKCSSPPIASGMNISGESLTATSNESIEKTTPKKSNSNSNQESKSFKDNMNSSNSSKKPFKPITNSNCCHAGHKKNVKNYEMNKKKLRQEAEVLRALIEPRICTFPIQTFKSSVDFRNLKNAHPSYRFSSPDEDEETKDLINDLEGLVSPRSPVSGETTQPYKMRYRNMKHGTSLSRQFSLMTPDDVTKLKKRRWYAVPTEI